MSNQNWQPISTAPKDMTDILLWDGISVSVGSWCTGNIHGGFWVSPDFGDWNAPGWEPTHWMPLPEPPVDEIDGVDTDPGEVVSS